MSQGMPFRAAETTTAKRNLARLPTGDHVATV
jgi:hypothetical protein